MKTAYCDVCGGVVFLPENGAFGDCLLWAVFLIGGIL